METSSANNQGQSLSELRKASKGDKKFVKWLRKHCPFFFNPRSLFYYGAIVFLIGIAWMIASLVSNSGTQLYGWDYQSQYVTFTYDFWDIWHTFFKTGHFELYSTSTYLGSDNIGSNAYYGLFDPFLFVCYIFPRSWIPQTFALATIFKGVASAMAMRAYARYLGVSENSSRLGGIAYAFSGYVCFFVGFPSFVSMAVAVPIILLGIEKVLKEQKPMTLCLGLAFMGLVSFFFLVVVCIFGALYAVWRFFATVKTRTVKVNFASMGLGVAAFAVGIMLSAWVLLPSFRESSLSGRTTSIGSAYLNSILNAFKDQDFGTIFARLFELVGNHPVRELQGLISFFYPTCNYLWLPLTQSGYDSWTSSLFSYTPVVILFFIGIFSAIRRKKWSHLAAFAICCYLVFTNFAYFFFYAFTGDGYGRWYIILMPIIIFYAMDELDRLKDEAPWVVITGSLFTLALAAFTWIFVSNYVPGKTFSQTSDHYTYWQTDYTVPATVTRSGVPHNLGWLVYYQLILYTVMGTAYILFRKKEWLHYIIFGSLVLEISVAGNLSFLYGSSYSYENSYNGGASRVATLTEIWNNINENDDSYFRGHTDSLAEKTTQQALGYNGTATFHSLFNYDLVQLTRYSHMTSNEGTSSAYGSTYYTKSWSGYYGNKRLAMDTSLGMKYYVIRNEGYGSDLSAGGCEPFLFDADNVPFGSELIANYGSYRVYRNTNVDDIALGHAVDSYYKQNKVETSPTQDDYYGSGSHTEVIRNEEIYLTGAIIQDSDIESFESENLWEEGEEKWTSKPSSYAAVNSDLTRITFSSALYTNTYNWWGPSLSTGGHEGPTYFLTDENTVISSTVPSTVNSDTDKVVLTPSNGSKYFNTDETGAYFLMYYNIDDYEQSIRNKKITRVYLIGDTFDEDGNIKEENVLLSYEYHTLRDYARMKVGYNGDVFGLYAKGRVKYICFCGKNSDGSTRTYEAPTLYMMERSAIDGENGILTKLKSSEYNLTDVEYSADKFTFKTNFSENRLVTTIIGYDAGWSVTATDASGNHYTPNTYKVDGGFLGFVAPGGVGEVTYTLSYHTPYLNEGFLLSMVGLFLLVGYESGRWIYRRNKKKNETPKEKSEFDDSPVAVEEIKLDDNEEPTS